ncbi:MAG: GNAT family N-acetyltransferase [Lacisediminihabitans sp.]
MHTGENIEAPTRDLPAVRVGRRDDLDGICEVQRRAGRSSSEKFTNAISDAIGDSKRLVVVAEAAGELAGWATTRYWPDHEAAAPAGHYLMGITVAPDQRRLGIGRSLIGARVEWIHHRADSVMFFANARNTASLTAHQRWPFHEISRGPEFRGVKFEGGLGLLLRAQLN